MRMRQRGRGEAVLVLLVAALASAPAAQAHVRKASGPYALEVGWRDEPPYSGAPNAVEVDVADAGGAPVSDPRAMLRVQLSFGDVRREVALQRAGPGRFAAAVVPTRPGIYALRVSGTLRGRSVDVAAICSQRTFDCVTDATAIQFPVAEPPAGALDAKLDRALARTRDAGERADRARTLASGALGAAALALLAALGLGVRRARQG